MKLPDFYYEGQLWGRGYEIVIGVDEVGRGALSGPLIAAAAAIKSKIQNPKSNSNSNFKIQKILGLGIDDSKRLKALQRLRLIPEIKRYFITAVGEASVGEINRIGIVAATGRAMRRAIKQILSNGRFFILVDGYPVGNLPGGMGRQMGIIDGDQKSISIAAAAVVAKVYRDKLMRKLSRQYPAYKWGRNKGYGTPAHRRALLEFGRCDFHRLIFIDGIGSAPIKSG